MMDISLGIGILVASMSVQASELSKDQKYKEATKHAVEASYKQTGLERKVQDLEKKYTPKWVSEHVGWALVVTKAAVENKVVIKWTF